MGQLKQGDGLVRRVRLSRAVGGSGFAGGASGRAVGLPVGDPGAARIEQVISAAARPQ
jgi:hypothetical protein